MAEQDENTNEAPNTEEKKGKVEFDTPEQQARFNDVWKQARASDERNKALIQHNAELAGSLENAIGEIDKIKTKFMTNEQNDALNDLRSNIVAARESGDDKKADELLEQLAEVKAEQKIREAAPARKVAEKPIDAFHENEKQYVHKLATETNSDGSIARPWMSASHPLHQKSLEAAATAARGYEARGIQVSVPMLMSEVEAIMDREMAKTSPVKRTQADVLSGGDLTSSGKSQKLTDEDKRTLKLLKIDPATFEKRRDMIRKSNGKVSASMFE